jgi:hypothetical protein
MAGDNNRIDGQEWEETLGEPLETEQLELTDEEERLPWLEASDDQYDDSYGSDNRRLMAFVLMGLVALAAIVGGIWWATHRTVDPALVADGSTVAAPTEPYKVSPRNPGGKQMDGTGDSSFAVSEGQNRQAHLGKGAAPSPSVNIGQPGAAAAAAAGTAATAAPAGGTGVQVAAYSSQAAAEAGWNRLVQQYSALSGVPHRVQQGQADIGTVFRLQAVASNPDAAAQLCGRLKAAGLACQVK